MTTTSLTLLIATNNPGKVAELRQMLSESRFRLMSLADLPDVPDVEETGQTFDENARLKAREYALSTGLHALADESGLEVEALSNRPGVLSARYGGDSMAFDQKMAKLLAELDESDNADRRARCVCSLAASDPQGRILFTSTGICRGVISSKPRGSGGFGYDPIFVPDGFDLTFGELSESVKQQISHRARAFEQIIPFLRDYNVN
jgi:XTP/dITP diphosphohydrolase